ncbi:MAG: hypothetical protein LBM93_03885 [Oscillospiraceae bacterium]|jgi:D-alanyl-D-alanine carboxypeptidase|nr:hypothetical protein [Oscillospiraceae bacterium]
MEEERQINPVKLVFLIVVLIFIVIIVATCNKKDEKKPKASDSGAKTTTTQAANPGGNNTTVTAALEEKTLEVKDSDVIKGNLILVNAQHAVQVTGTVDDVTATLNLKNVLENKNDYVHVTENAISLSQPALAAFCDLMTAYHAENGKDDIYIRKGYSSEDILSDFATGLCLSIRLKDTFNGSTAYVYKPDEKQWFMFVTDHAAEYGFILRYPKDKSSITLIAPEDESDSTFRYVGIPHAKYIAEQNITLEEYIAIVQTRTKLSPLVIQNIENGVPVEYKVYYVSSVDAAGKIKYNSENISVSGDNMGGYIVTTW